MSLHNPNGLAGVVAQHAYSYQWYGMTVTNPAGCILGFQRSYEARNAGLSAFSFPPSSSEFRLGVSYFQSISGAAPLDLSFEPPRSQALGNQADYVLQSVTATPHLVGNVTATIQRTPLNSGQWVEQAFNHVTGVASQGGQTVVDFSGSAVLHLTLTTTPPSPPGPQGTDGSVHPMGGSGGNGASNTVPMVWLPIQFPASATGMAFDFTVDGNPRGDWLVCSVGQSNLFRSKRNTFPPTRCPQAG